MSLTTENDPNAPSDITTNLITPQVPLVLPSLRIIKDPDTPGDNTRFPKPGDTVWVHYEGFLENNEKFDSSRDRNAPFKTEIGVGKVIKGWDEGIPQLSVGGKATLIVKPEWAYKARGYPPIIPPNATLRFEVELLDVQVKKKD